MADIDKRLHWKPYPDPLYKHYNLGEMSEAEKEKWYNDRTTNPNVLYLAIDSLKGELIGFLNIFNIDRKNKRAKFGIYLGYEFINQGYGTEAINILLCHYFEKLKFRKLYLGVASLNHRAIHCYQKCGFEYIRTTYQKHDPRSNIDIFGDEKFKDIRKYFKLEGDDILVEFQEMQITKELWRKHLLE
jgi:diamine N-acetyltransferase